MVESSIRTESDHLSRLHALLDQALDLEGPERERWLEAIRLEEPEVALGQPSGQVRGHGVGRGHVAPIAGGVRSFRERGTVTVPHSVP